MKAKELRDKSVNELQQMEQDLSRDLWKTRFNKVTSKLDDTAKIRRLRRDIARVKTVLGQRAVESEGKSV